MKIAPDAFTSAILAAAVLVAAGVSMPLSEEVLVSANVAEVGKGQRTRVLLGRTVWNDRNERIGTILEVVIGRDDIAFAILEVGGFLELGPHLVAVPFKTLKIDERSRMIVLPGATRRALEGFPEFRFPG
jgi:PRC-barrel domain